MKLKSKKLISFDIEVYGGKLVFSYGHDSQTILDLLSDGELTSNRMILHIAESFEEHELLTNPNSGVTFSDGHFTLIALPFHTDIPQLANTVAHEVFHAVHAILREKGLKLTNASEEAYAYLTGYITEKLWN